VAARLVANLARLCPLLPGADRLAYVDVDDTVKATYGYGTQGAGHGYTKVKGLNALLATVCTPLADPVIVASRLRRGAANSARGAARLVADALATAKQTGADPSRGALVIVRADSAFYGYPVVAAARRAGARFSVTARQGPSVRRAITTIDPQAWVPIHYPNAFEDPATGELISDAEVAEVPFTAFTSRRRSQQVTARLIVRRVRRLNPAGVPAGQGELFTTWRYHCCFTDSPQPLLDAEAAHRGHAIVEQVHADLKHGPLAHLPSSSFPANSAWLVLAAIAFNLTRAAGTLASACHARATTGTIRTQLITVPARIARSARQLTVHLPRDWPWEHGWQQLFTATVHHPPPAST
jgi:hypothetical protein